jgi:PAS domain S-box-containing protein
MLLRRHSIRRRLTAMSALSSSVALLLACFAFLGYELITFRASLVDDLSADAKVLAFGLTAPLLFEDPQAATASLEALRAKPRIRFAILTGKNGKTFATYGQTRLTPAELAQHSAAFSYQFQRDRLLLTMPVLSEGAPIGTLMIESSLDELGRRVRQYLLVTASVLIIALIAALGISSWLQQRILQSITQLTGAAQKVSRNADYSVRVDPQEGDELGVLATTFNDMLAKIEEQDAARERTLEALRISDARFARLLDAGIIGIIVADRAGNILEANDAFLDLVDYSREDLRAGKVHWAEMTPPEWRATNEEVSHQLAAAGTPRPFEMEYFRKDGTRAPVLVGIVNLDDAGTISFVLDITERKRLEQVRRDAFELEVQNRRIQEANRLKSEFLANMSHELRTPLNAILGFGELLHDGVVAPDSPQHREFLSAILKSGRHLLQLINDVLDLAKIEAGKVEFRPETIDLPIVIDEVMGIVKAIAVAKNIRISASVDPELNGGIFLDPARLKQILYNFISNALKFTPVGGAVSVRARVEDEARLRLEVEDTGPGIAREDMDRLFVEFQQLDAGLAKQHAGTGLGLALTRRLVEAQGGSVGVRSTPGQGSIFYAVLPRRSPSTSTLQPHQRLLAAPPGSPSVLVIEDDSRDQALLVEALSKAGYSVHVASTGAEAVALCAVRKFDAISLDLLLPDMSGQAVLKHLRASELNRDVPVVVLTMVAERGAIAAFAIHDFLQKPVDVGELLSSLSRAGVWPEQPGSVLVVDDDEGSLKLMAAALTQLGFRPSCTHDGEEGLRLTARAPPVAVVLDLLMPVMDGFEFLDRLRDSPATRLTPVLIWTVKDLSGHEQARLSRSAQAIVRKGHGGIPALLEDLRRFLPKRSDPQRPV